MTLLAGVFGLALFLMLGAARDLVRTVLALRHYAGFVDHPRSLEVDPEQTIARLALPASDVFRSADRAIILVLSDRCVTCFAILKRLQAILPMDRLLVLLNTRSDLVADAWLSNYGLAISEQIVHDEFGLIAAQIGVTSTPATIKVQSGAPVAASTIPSVGRFDEALDWIR